jgi:ketosteroid isomerase-like protein
MNLQNHTTTSTDVKQVVLDFITALNEEDFASARVQAADDMVFTGVMGSRNGADAYFKDMEHMRLKYDIKKTFADEEDVCLFYNITMSGAMIFSCGWYHVKNGKIQTIRVIFDPRPLLDNAKK